MRTRCDQDGLSPRLRGNPHVVLADDQLLGSIPAPAGEPSPAPARSGPRGVYPRACGGTDVIRLYLESKNGLSPRLRGNPGRGRWQHYLFRSIPAPAGEPVGVAVGYQVDQVYPRACGGTAAGFIATAVTGGLSPRLRGNHARMVSICRNRRSIPAPAGEPSPRRWS